MFVTIPKKQESNVLTIQAPKGRTKTILYGKAGGTHQDRRRKARVNQKRDW